jgi:hypothetical protein
METVTTPDQLSTEQCELLAAAAKNRGQLSVCVRSDTNGRAVRGKTERFFDPNNPEIADQYVQGLKEMEGLLLVRQGARRGTFELTNNGWLVSRKLAR